MERRDYFAFSFLARRPSRYLLILAFGTSLCFAQTIPKTGAAGFLQPGIVGALLTPTMAAAAMAFSSVSVIGNALRLRRAQV
jgi:cation transport ATPase